MAAKATRISRKKASTSSESLRSKWESVTWGDIETWAGSRTMERGRAYQQGGRVRDLVIMDDGRLFATVLGEYLYATSVWWGAHALHSKCSCPVDGYTCKHAVAVILAYLDMLAKDTPIPSADAEDLADHRNRPVSQQHVEEGRIDDDQIQKHIDTKNREELATLIWSLTRRFPDVREELCEDIAFGEGNADRLIANVRKELRRATSNPGWRNYWEGEGYTPDFSRLARHLDRMVEFGHADAVVELSAEIMVRGMEQAEQPDDEGETLMAFVRCLEPVFRAVTESTLAPSQKLLFAIDANIDDKYGVIENGLLDTVLKCSVTQSDWSTVADELTARLKSDARAGSSSYGTYRRKRISIWLLRALKQAGRDNETLSVHEMEASITGNYEPLVSLLIEQKRYNDAERCAMEGIQKTLREAPGLAEQLAGKMAEIARHRRKWNVVAAHTARRFFERPDPGNFAELVAAAETARCRDAVERLALKFLETGKLPFSVAVGKDGSYSVALHSGWPLPLPVYLLPLMRTRDTQPHYNVLIDIAIAERRPDDVLHWYDAWDATVKEQRAPWFYGAGSPADKVAAAVAESHPERCVEIYRKCVEENLTRANITAYETVATYLKKMRPIMKSLDHGWQWNELVADIRVSYRNRPKFIEILNRSLEARPILQKSGARK